jgi:uncharacterized protein
MQAMRTLIDPKHLAFQGYHLNERVGLAQLRRLHESLYEFKGEVEIDLQFAVDDQDRPTIVGRVMAHFPLLCQCCLQSMPWSIDASVALMILKDGQTEDDLPEGYDALTLTGTQISLITLIEDELILALPIVPKHSVCPPNEYQVRESELENSNLQKNNPFQVLSTLKISK